MALAMPDAATPTPKAAPAPKPTGPVPAGNPAPTPTQSVPPPSAPNGAMAGFDTCAAPSLPTMKAWRAKYSATAIYLVASRVAHG